MLLLNYLEPIFIFIFFKKISTSKLKTVCKVSETIKLDILNKIPFIFKLVIDFEFYIIYLSLYIENR